MLITPLTGILAGRRPYREGAGAAGQTQTGLAGHRREQVKEGRQGGGTDVFYLHPQRSVCPARRSLKYVAEGLKQGDVFQQAVFIFIAGHESQYTVHTIF